MVVLEVKGEDSPENRAKRMFLAEWVEVVNGMGTFGEWAADVALSPDETQDILARQSRMTSVLAT